MTCGDYGGLTVKNEPCKRTAGWGVPGTDEGPCKTHLEQEPAEPQLQTVTAPDGWAYAVRLDRGTMEQAYAVTLTPFPVKQEPEEPAPEPDPPPTTPDAIDATVHRFASGIVSSGFPLPPGALTDASLVRVLVNGVEVPAFVKALHGRHSDGTLRSVLIQVDATATSVQIALGQPRTKQRTEVPVAFTYASPVPAAILAPPRDYLLTTGIVMPTTPAPDPFNAKYENRMISQSDGRWPVFKADYDAGTVGTGITPNYYDRALFHWAWWVRTGDVKYWERAAHYLMAYRENYMRPNNYAVQPHNMMPEGFELHYLLTGDEESRRGVGEMAKLLTSPTGWIGRIVPDSPPSWMEGRIMSRILLGILTAYRLELETKDARQSGNVRALTEQAVDRILAMQKPDGSYIGGSDVCGKQLNYMTGLVNEVFAKYHDLIEPDPRILAAVEKAAEYMWATQWKVEGDIGGFAYLNDGSCGGVGSHGEPTPDLNHLIGHGFGWLYARTGDVKWRERGDLIFAEGVDHAWFGHANFEYKQAEKQYNESYRSSWQYLAYRR